MMHQKNDDTCVFADSFQSAVKGVTFRPHMKVKIVPTASDMTEDEHKACWHDDADSDATQTDIVRTIRAMRLNTPTRALERDGMCARGLEHMQSSSALQAQRRNKAEVVRAVLREQEHQRRAASGVTHDPDAIREASLRVSAESTKSALKYGISDREFVRTVVLRRKKASPTAPKGRSGDKDNVLKLSATLSSALEITTAASSQLPLTQKNLPFASRSKHFARQSNNSGRSEQVTVASIMPPTA